MYKLEAGNEYKDLIDMGVSHKKAKKVAKTVGTINAAIESGENVVDLISFSGAGKIAEQEIKNATAAKMRNKFFDIIDTLGEKEAKEYISEKYGTTVAENIFKTYTKNLISEGLQEGSQETVSVLGERKAAKDEGIARDNSKDLERIKKASISGMTTAGVTGPVTSTIGNIASYSTTKLGQKIQNPNISNTNNVNAAQLTKGNTWNTKLQDLTKVSDTVNQIQEQVQQGAMTPQEGNIALQQVQNGTFDENRNLDMIVNQKVQELQQAVQQGMITPEQGTAEMETIKQVAQQQFNEINNNSELNDKQKNQINTQLEKYGNFGEQIDAVKQGNYPKKDVLVVSKSTPQVYKDIGLGDLPITMTQKHLYTITNAEGKYKNSNYHDIDIDVLKQLPEALENPLNVLKSSTRDDSIVAITALADKNDKPIVASIKIDGEGRINDIKINSNALTSTYGKDNYDSFMQREIKKGNLLYDIDEGTKKRITRDRVQFPMQGNSSVNNIPQTNQNVNDISTTNNMQNNKNDTLYENKSENVLKITPEIKKESAKQIADNINNGLKERSYIETATTALNSEELTKQMENDAKVYEPHTNKKTLERAKRNLNNIKDYDSRVAYIKSLLNSNQRLTDANIAEAQLVLSEAARNKDVQNYNDLLQYTSLYATEAGQTIQALSMIKKMGPTGQLEMLRKIVSRNQALGKKAYNNVEITPEMTQKILDVYNEDGSYDEQKMFEAVDEVKQDIADQMNVSIADKLNAWRYLSMLGNPKTHIRNIVANVAMTATKDVKNTVSSATQDIFIRDKSKKTTTLAMPTKEVKNYSQIAYNEVFEELKQNKYDEQSDIESKRQIFKLKPLDKVNKFNSWALEAEDQMFKKPAFKSAFSKYLTAQGIKTQVDIENNPQVIEQAKQYALQQSLEATFQQKNSLANFINKMDNLGPGGKVARGALIPFTRTPLNIAKTGIEYTPGAGMLTTISAVKKAPSNLKAATFIDGMSKQTTGASLALVGYMLAKAGILKSGGKGDKEDKYLKDLGEQDFSVTLGDKTYDLSWLSPSAMPMFVGAAMFEKLEEQEEMSPNVVIDTIMNTTDPLSSMSCIKSFTDTLQSYGKGNASLGTAAKNMVNNYITQFIPTLSSQFAAAFDDRKRMTSADKNSDFTWGDELKNQLMYKTPGLRNKLEEKTDSWGRTVYEETDPIKRAAQTFLSPATTKNKTADYLDYELLDLYNETGETEALPAQAQKYLQYAKEKYNLSNKEFNNYKRTYGNIARTALNELVDSDEYIDADSNEQLKMVKKVYKYASYKAKKEYFDEYGVDYKPQSYKTYALYDAFGFPIEEVAKVDLNSITSDYDSDGNTIRGSRKRKIIQAVNSMNLSVPQKAALIRKNTMAFGKVTFKSYSNEIAQEIVDSDLSIEEKRELLNSLGYNVR